MSNKNDITRREFGKLTVGVVAAGTIGPKAQGAQKADNKAMLRMGGPVEAQEPEAWIKKLNELGYRAAYCPVGADANDEQINSYARAAKQADVVIAEVGAWSNPLSKDDKTRNEAIAYCKRQLALAERIGANCCVNISGSRGKSWSGPDDENLTAKTFDMIVAVTREIIDEVKPKRTYFTLEMMPWSYPDSTESYLELIKAIDRDRFGVHLDPVNIISSPQKYYNNGKIIRECFSKLGKYVKSCHAKDIIIEDKATIHLSEIRPGLGKLDYTAYLTELSKYPDLPLMLEHLQTQQEYKQAADHIRKVGSETGFKFHESM